MDHSLYLNNTSQYSGVYSSTLRSRYKLSHLDCQYISLQVCKSAGIDSLSIRMFEYQ